MLKKIQSIYLKLYGKLFSPPHHISPEAIIWGYRLFLDREPESPLVVADKLKRLASTHDIRRDFVSSEEFKQKNPGFHSLCISGNEPPMFIERVSDLQGLFFHIQNVWERLGETEPYWSVAT